jgi:predicted CoA-substrate-specific enzyme activase
LLDFPKIKTDKAADFLAEVLRELKKRAVKYAAAEIRDPSPVLKKEGKGKIGFVGGNLPMSIINKILGDYDIEPIFLNHCLMKTLPSQRGREALSDPSMLEYAKYSLQKNSCPRTLDNNYKNELKKEIVSQDLMGVICLTFKFCDFQTFDYLYLRGDLPDNFPILLVEHEGSTANEGQIMTRIQAFVEQLKGIGTSTRRTSKKNKYFVGIDSGSHATKMVCLDADGKILFRKMVPTGTSIQKSVENLLKEIPGKDFTLTATGYGRNQITKADEVITEITCHAKGVYRTQKIAGTIIDIGGQDSKAINIGECGQISRFAMNDKCAAGTGRFLEVIAQRLELTLEDFAKLAVASKNTLPVSNMCAVFAESEVISMIAKGHNTAEIAKGIHQAIAERTASLVRRINGAPPYFMTGGVANNPAIIAALSKELNAKINVMEEPQFSGALGAAMVALEKNS